MSSMYSSLPQDGQVGSAYSKLSSHATQTARLRSVIGTLESVRTIVLIIAMSSCQVLRQSRYQAHVDLQIANIMGFILYLAVGEIAHDAFLTGLGWPGLVRLGPYRRSLESSFFPAVRRRTPRASCSPAGAVWGGVRFVRAAARCPRRGDRRP